MMNRDKMNKLPEMQIAFIDSICTPIYTAFAFLFPHELTPLLEGCLTNRAVWDDLAKGDRLQPSRPNSRSRDATRARSRLTTQPDDTSSLKPPLNNTHQPHNSPLKIHDKSLNSSWSSFRSVQGAGANPISASEIKIAQREQLIHRKSV